MKRNTDSGRPKSAHAKNDREVLSDLRQLGELAIRLADDHDLNTSDPTIRQDELRAIHLGLDVHDLLLSSIAGRLQAGAHVETGPYSAEHEPGGFDPDYGPASGTEGAGVSVDFSLALRSAAA